jgi:hypothetical protein
MGRQAAFFLSPSKNIPITSSVSPRYIFLTCRPNFSPSFSSLGCHTYSGLNESIDACRVITGSSRSASFRCEPNLNHEARGQATIPAANDETTTTRAVSGIAAAQNTHCGASMVRMSRVFIPKMLATVEMGRKITVTMVKT